MISICHTTESWRTYKKSSTLVPLFSLQKDQPTNKNAQSALLPYFSRSHGVFADHSPKEATAQLVSGSLVAMGLHRRDMHEFKVVDDRHFSLAVCITGGFIYPALISMQTNGLGAVFMLLNPCFNPEDRNYFGEPITNLFYLNSDIIGHIASWVSFPLTGQISLRLIWIRLRTLSCLPSPCRMPRTKEPGTRAKRKNQLPLQERSPNLYR